MKAKPSGPERLALQGASAALRSLSVESAAACAARLASDPLQSPRASQGIPRQTPRPDAPTPDTAQPAASGAPRIALAFDFGLRRVGVACGDTVSRTATALDGVPNGPSGPRWEIIDTLVREWQPALLVIGLPYNVDGSDSAMTVAARGFADNLRRRFGLQAVLVDERYSSREAEARLKSARESGVRRRRVAKADVDAAAACVILERWFTEET